MRNRLVIILGLVASVLVIAALFGPWWTQSRQWWTSTRWTLGLYGPFGVTSSDWSSPPQFVGWPSGYPISTLFFDVGGLAVAGMALGLAMVASTLLSGSRPRLLTLSVVLGFPAASLLLAAPLMLMLYLPGIMNQNQGPNAVYTSFWGSKDYPQTAYGAYTLTWGAGWAWYALLVAAGLLFTAAIRLLLDLWASARGAAASGAQPPPGGS